MKKTITRILSLLLAVLMLMTLLVACKKKDADEKTEMKIYVLNGTTALGMAQLMDKVANNTAELDYQISVKSSADEITGPIINGECAIAALPTNAAAKLYKVSEGKIQLLALNTLGVLYLLQSGNTTVASLQDLKGKTIHLPGEGTNPEIIMKALLQSANLTVGKDVFLNSTAYPSPDDLTTAVAAGKVDLAVLPEPKVSVVTSKNTSVKVALNLTTEWEAINGKDTLVQGCLVVNTEFAKEHPDEVKKFLKDYEESVHFIKAGSDEAINMVVNAKLLPNAGVAKKALPNCNLCCITGESMKVPMNTFCEKMFAAVPTSVGAIPNDAFYYVAK